MSDIKLYPLKSDSFLNFIKIYADVLVLYPIFSEPQR